MDDKFKKFKSIWYNFLIVWNKEKKMNSKIDVIECKKNLHQNQTLRSRTISFLFYNVSYSGN